jgi:rhodanese-related sulfurtransferase
MLGRLSAVPVREIDVDQLSERLAAGAPLIDVREPDEYVDGHVPGAVLVPLATVPDHVDAFAAGATTYVICRSGARSMRACEYVAGLGLDGVEVVNVAGGTLAWQASGRETVGGDQPS